MRRGLSFENRMKKCATRLAPLFLRVATRDHPLLQFYFRFFRPTQEGLVFRQRKGEDGSMNLSLSFPEFSEERALARQPDLEAVLAHFRALMQKDDSPIRAIRHQPARAAEYVDIPESVHPKLREGLIRRNVPKLYSHQAESFELVKTGKNVVIVTPTASGKTLCYNLPVLDLLLRDPEARAVYLYPTKALAEDQLHEFQTAVEEIGCDLRAFTYDGDTPQDARKAIR